MALRPDSDRLLLVAACLLLNSVLERGYIPFRGTLGNFSRTDPIVAHLEMIAMSYSHKFSSPMRRCTIAGETRL